jgi:hypothetical protein
MRRRIIGGSLLLIMVGVVLGATVFRTDIAQATRLAQSVVIANTPAQAVPVREQAALQPVEAQTAATFESGASFSNDVTLYTVPAGKTLVIDSFSFTSPTNANDYVINARLEVELGSSNEFTWFQPAVNEGLTTLGARVFGGASQVTAYAGPGTDVVASASRGGTVLGGTGVLFAMSGHLVNMP